MIYLIYISMQQIERINSYNFFMNNKPKQLPAQDFFGEHLRSVEQCHRVSGPEYQPRPKKS